MTDFKDYLVVLHSSRKQQKQRRITKCVSKSAAVRVADLKERIEQHREHFWSSLVYELDKNGRPIFG